MNYDVLIIFSPNALLFRFSYSSSHVVIFSELTQAFKTFSEEGDTRPASSFFLKKLIKSYQGIAIYLAKQKKYFFVGGMSASDHIS
jgi:hypothetical protein